MIGQVEINAGITNESKVYNGKSREMLITGQQSIETQNIQLFKGN